MANCMVLSQKLKIEQKQTNKQTNQNYHMTQQLYFWVKWRLQEISVHPHLKQLIHNRQKVGATQVFLKIETK